MGLYLGSDPPSPLRSLNEQWHLKSSLVRVGRAQARLQAIQVESFELFGIIRAYEAYTNDLSMTLEHCSIAVILELDWKCCAFRNARFQTLETRQVVFEVVVAVVFRIQT